MTKLLALFMSLLALTSCSNGAEGEGEGEGPDGEGESQAEGEGDSGEGEGEGEGEGDGGEGEGEVEIFDLGTRTMPTVVTLPFDELVAGPTEECLAVEVADGQVVNLQASSRGPCEEFESDAVIVVVDRSTGEEVGYDDFGGLGACAELEVLLSTGSYAVCLFDYDQAPLPPHQFTVSTSLLTLVDIGGDCTASDATCDPIERDRTGDGLDDRVTCDGVCVLVTRIAEGDSCSPDDLNSECDPSSSTSCLSTALDEFICTDFTQIPIGDPCDPNVTALVCIFGSVCDDNNVCSFGFTQACLVAEEALLGDNTIDLGAETFPDGTCSFSDSQRAFVYTPSQSGVVVRVATADSVIAVRSSCTTQLAECAYPFDDAPADVFSLSGEPLYLFITGNDFDQTQATFSIEELPLTLLEEGDSCDRFDLLSVCNEDLFCNNVACEVAGILFLDEPTDVTYVPGQLLCLAVEEPGNHRFTTSGSCETDDESFSYIDHYRGSDVLEYSVNEGSGNCQVLEATLEEGDVVCVTGFSAEPQITTTVTATALP